MFLAAWHLDAAMLLTVLCSEDCGEERDPSHGSPEGHSPWPVGLWPWRGGGERCHGLREDHSSKSLAAANLLCNCLVLPLVDSATRQQISYIPITIKVYEQIYLYDNVHTKLEFFFLFKLCDILEEFSLLWQYQSIPKRDVYLEAIYRLKTNDGCDDCLMSEMFYPYGQF